MNLFRILVPLLLGAASLMAQAKPSTPVEHVLMSGTGWPDVLGTREYQPSKAEKPIHDALPENERLVNVLSSTYELAARAGKRVGWYGVIRAIEEDDESDTTTLLVEHKHSTGLTDLHQQVVSFHGGGDFSVRLDGRGLGLHLLDLVKVYGRVESPVAERPAVNAVQYVRHWEWGTWAFIGAIGEDASNPAWREQSKLGKDDRLYSSNPNAAYYRKRLGGRPEIPGEVHVFEVLRQEPAAKGKPASGPGPVYRDDKGRGLTFEQYLAFLLNHGCRRHRTWVPADPQKSRTAIVFSVDPEDAAFRGLAVNLFGRRLDVGIDRFYLRPRGADGMGYRLRPDDVEHPFVDLQEAPGILVRGPLPARPGTKTKEKAIGLSWSFIPKLGEKHSTDLKREELPERLRELAASGTRVLTVSYLGGVPMKEIFAVAEAARAAGIPEVELGGERQSPRMPRWDFDSGMPSRAPEQEKLEKLVAARVALWLGRVRDDMLWFPTPRPRTGQEDAELSEGLKSLVGTLMSGPAQNALLLGAAGMYGQLEVDATEYERYSESLGAMVTSLEALSFERGADLRGIGKLAFGLVRAQSFAFDDDLEGALAALFTKLTRLRLAEGGWPQEVGGQDPDLEASAFISMAYAEARAIEIPGTESGKLIADTAWMEVLTDPKTGFVSVGPESPAAFSTLDFEQMSRMTHGHHPEYATALAVACRLAAGEPAGKGMAWRQLERLRAIPPAHNVASAYFDSHHALVTAWVMAAHDLSAWRSYATALRRAVGEHIDRRGTMDEVNARLSNQPAMTWVRVALTVGLLREFEANKDR